MKRRLSSMLGLSTLSMMVAGGVLVGTAGAASASTTVHCGDIITQNTTLANDVGPCTGDGIKVQGDGITIDLAGHTITGSHGMAAIPKNEQVGIHLQRVTGVTVKGPGVVKLFDAGVGIDGGGGNTVMGVTVRDNINYNVVYDTTNNDQHPTTQQEYGALVSTCNYGDGITTDNSNANRIANNTVIHNGPYSGVSMVDNSDGNVVTDNTVKNQTVANVDPTGIPTVCGASFVLHVGMQLGRGSQDVGIRVEGPGANNNRVTNNIVNNQLLAGISMNSNVCHQPAETGKPPENPNTNSFILNNTVSGTSAGSGIAIFASGPNGTITCPSYGNTIDHNTSNNNSEDGIFVAPLSHDNTITNNTVNRNQQNGIELGGPFTSGGTNFSGATSNTLHGNQGHYNAVFDGRDDNPQCDSNHWRNDSFGTVNQGCVQ